MKKRILSMLLVIVMVLSMVPVTALADGAISVAGLPQTAAVGGEVIFSATVDGNPITDATWESSDLNIAKPIRIEGTNQCRIEGVGQGAAKITVKKEGLTDGVRWASFYIKQDSVAIEGPTTVTAGENVKLSFAVPEGVTQKNVKWTLDESCTTYASMDSETANPMTLSVNANAVGKKVKVNLSFNGAENTKELEIVAPTPGKITVTEPSDLHNVCVGKSLTLTAKIDVNPANADFTVDKEGIVDIAKSGNVFTVTGKAPGEVTINFTMTGSQNRKYEGSYKVTVDPLKTMEIRADSDAFFTGKTVQLRAFEGDKELTGVVWWCDTPSVANAAYETGLLTCVGAGPAKVKARLDNYNDAWLPITVAANTLQIQSKADKKAVSQINVGDQIELEVVDAAGDAVAVTSWDSSNVTAATVTDGLLKGLKKSDTAVTITANVSGTEVKQEITVNNKSFTVKNGDEVLTSDSVLTIYVGDDPIQLTAWNGETPLTCTWYNRSKDKITVDKGSVTGIAPTEADKPAEIVVGANGYDNVTVKVKVLPKNTFIKLRLDNPDVRPTDLAVGETRQLVALKDTTSGPVEGVEWKIVSGNEFAVLEGDQLTGKADGTVVLTATCYGFETKTVEIYVSTEKLNSVTIPASLELDEGETKDLLADAVFDPVYASDKTVTFRPKEAKDADVVEIDGRIVKAKRYGTATVTGTYKGVTGDKDVEVTVTVKAANHIELVELDPIIPTELVCGDTLELKAVLKNAAGETLETPVQWQLSNDKVIKNLVDLTGNKLTAHPQSTYDFKVFLEAFVEGNDQVEPIIVTVHVIPRTTNIALKKGDEDISDKTIVLNVNDPNGITIDAVIKPNDASQVVDWEIDGPNSIYKATRSEKGIKIEPVITQKTGTITVTATAKDGTGISRKTTIVFAKMADRVVITNAPDMMMGGANIQLRTNLDEDKTLTERQVKWSIVDETGKEGNTRYASVTADGLLDTKSVTERTKIYVQATMLANPDNHPDVKEIWLCPAVNRINIMQQTETTDSKGDPILINVKNVVDYSEKTIKLDKIAYPAGHIASFVWDSSNKAVADFVPGTSELQLKGAGKTQITCTATDGSNTRGVYNLEVVKTAGYVVIDEVDQLVSGKNTVLTATVYTEEDGELAANQKVTWSVEDEYGNPTKAATINSRGRLYAKTVKYGTEVVVVAKSVENKDAEPGRISVTIKPKQTKTFMAVMTAEPEGIILGSSLDLNVGVETSIFGQWYISEDNEFDREYDCTYNSSNRNVATIDPEGTLETLKSGSTVITVRATDPDTHNVYTTKFTLRVANLVGHVHIDEADKGLNMRSGQSMNLTATAWTDSGMATKSDNQGFIWKVYQEDEETGERVIAKAASVSSSGKVYANSVTKNTMVWVEAISRENSDQISSPCPIMIRPKDVYTPRVFFVGVDENGEYKELSGTVSRSITSDPRDIQVRAYASDPSFDYTMDGYDMNPLTVFNVTWDSSNKKVIDVVGNQLVYKDTGKATVTAKFTANGITYSASITINVVRPVTSLEVTSRTSSLDMYAGKSLLMLAKVNSDATNKRVEWSFFDEDDYEIASINSTTGLIRAKKGLTDRETVTVIAKTTDGSEITSVPVTVTIYPLATKVEINEDSRITMVKGSEDTLSATVYPDGDLGANPKVTWSSSRSSVVSVDKEGNITAKRRGTATIKAKATDGSGKYATIKITVVNP